MGLDLVTAGRSVPDEINVIIEIPKDADPIKYEHYKDLEISKWVEINGWHDAESARREIVECIERYQSSPDKPAF